MRGGMTLSLPPFTRAVKTLIIVNTAVFVLMFLLPLVSLGSISTAMKVYGYLSVPAVLHGWLWQLVSYAFFHITFGHLFFNMFTLWMFGGQFEMGWGRSRFLEFFFWCVLGASLSTVGIALLGRLLFNAVPLPLFAIFANVWNHPTAGASGGIYGLLIAYGMLYGDREIFLFPIPFSIKARYMVAIWIAIAVVGALGEQGGIANFAHLGGALFGWIYLRFLPSRGLGFASSEGYYGMRNWYYRWKRKRAQKRFEVYMNKHRKEDAYLHKDDRNSGPGASQGPWVN